MSGLRKVVEMSADEMAWRGPNDEKIRGTRTSTNGSRPKKGANADERVPIFVTQHRIFGADDTEMGWTGVHGEGIMKLSTFNDDFGAFSELFMKNLTEDKRFMIERQKTLRITYTCHDLAVRPPRRPPRAARRPPPAARLPLEYPTSHAARGPGRRRSRTS